MPRPLAYGNGRLLIAFDQRHQGRDLFWPNIGYPNHLLGHKLRVGAWVDGSLYWCDGDDWEHLMGYRESSMVGHSLWRSWHAGLEIEVEEALDPEDPVFVRSFLVRDLRGLERDVVLFFTQHFILGQSDVGNTAFYNPFCDAVVHYRGPYYALATAQTDAGGIEQYSTGLKDFGGFEGTWRDAEDGRLAGNPIAQGSVDSTFSVTVHHGGKALNALVLGDRLDTAQDSLERVKARGWDSVFDRSTKETRNWLNQTQAPPMTQLSEGVQRLFWQSLVLIRTQIDHGGAVLAANDADILSTNRATYSYCWPRDGALVCRLMARLGHTDIARAFLGFCRQTKPHDHSFFLQKYRSDGSLGASWHPWLVKGRPEVPFQQDETALPLLLLAEHGDTSQSDEWTQFGRSIADFLIEHTDVTGLPKPSWDLWEERHGVHFFTACSVVAALSAVSRKSGVSPDEQDRFETAAQAMKTALHKLFWSPSLGRYVRMIGDEGQDPTPDSAIIGGLLLSPDTWLNGAPSTVETLRRELAVEGEIGGFARYGGDYYFRKSDSLPGNPWVISTMWFARAALRTGDVEGAVKLLEWVTDRAEPTGVLAEQYHPETGEALSVSPLTWSHAEFVETVLDACSQVG